MIGEKIKKLAENANLTREDMASKLGISKPTLDRLYLSDVIDTEKLKKLCQIFDKPMSYWFDDYQEVVSKKEVQIKNDDSAMVEELKATNEFLKEELQYFKDLVKQQFQMLNNKLDKMGKHNGVEGSQQKDNTIPFRPVHKVEQLSLGFAL